jgi:class 3 adenylate cyclase
MDRLVHILAEAVHRFEGTIEKFTGDGVMALFGAPVAHEDHAVVPATRPCTCSMRWRASPTSSARVRA